MSSVFKALSDPTRRRVLQLLRAGPKSAGEISDRFDVSKPTMSAHFAVLKEAYAEAALPVPAPEPGQSISVEKLSELSGLVKVSRLAELAGIPGPTLAAKLKRRTPFSPGESRRISRALRDNGLAVR